MPQALIFGNNQESGDSELAGASPLAMNVLVDGKGAARRRPGIAAYSNGSAASLDAAGIAGLYVTARNDLLAVGAGRHIFRMATGTGADLSGAGGDTVLEGTSRPTFAENEVALIVAGGGEIQKIDLTTFASTHLGAASTDRPPRASQVAANSSRFLSNDVSAYSVAGQIRYSQPGLVDYDEWPGRFFITAEAKPDPIVAIAESTDDVWAWGTDTTQIFAPDATSVYAPVHTLRGFGLAATASIVQVDTQFAWFDRSKRFLLSDGRSTKDISQGISGTLEKVATISDCIGYRILIDQFDALIWTFPTDGRSFCYQVGGGWSQWSTHRTSSSGPAVFPVTACVARGADDTLVAGLNTGAVAQLSTDATDDLGEPIVADVMTGYVRHGTDAFKWCEVVRLGFQRGETTATLDTDEPVAFLAWRDDGGAWGDAVPVGLGTSGDREIVVELRGLGTYRRRQWRLTFSGSEEWVLASAEEEFVVS